MPPPTIAVFLVTIPRYRDRALATQRHLTHEMGFASHDIEWVKGQEATDPESTLQAASMSHYRAAESVLLKQNPALIIEDDCRFVDTTTKNTTATLAKAVQFLNIYDSAWQILMVGHCPLGPICPLAEYPGLSRTSFPFSAIAYMLNPRTLGALMAAIPASSWRRPLMVEGWLGLNPAHKYAFTESLTTLGDTPKEIRCIPVLNTMDLTAAAWTLSSLGTVLYPLLWGLFRVFHIMARLWLGFFRRPQQLLGIGTPLDTGDLVIVRHYPGLESIVERSSIPTHAGVIYRDPITSCTYIFHMCNLHYDAFSGFFRPQAQYLFLEPLAKYLQSAIEKEKTRVAVHRLEVATTAAAETLQKKFDALVGEKTGSLYVAQPAHNIFSQFFMSKPELFPFIGEAEYEVSTEGVHYSNCFNAVMDIYEQIGVCRRQPPYRQIVNVDAFVNPNLSFPLRQGFSFRFDGNCLQKKKP